MKPTGRHTRSARNSRRSHLSLKPIALVSCPKCGKKLLAHRACPVCGTYKGKAVINTEKRSLRAMRNKHGK